MKRIVTAGLLTLGVLALAGCNGRTDKTDGGGVLLSVTDFDSLPIQASVNSTGDFVQVTSITIANIPKNPTANTSDLMNVEIKSYQVTYTRTDGGTRVPPPLVRGLFGVVPVGGTNQYDNLPVVTAEQLSNPPLSDLLFINGGVDKETGSPSIGLNLHLTFFGETLSGKEVATAPVDFHVQFTP